MDFMKGALISDFHSISISFSLFRYYADIRQTISASDQEMNSALAELSRVCYIKIK
jgi:hypothetical protein